MCAYAVTHAHLDHVGALPLLLPKYPNLKVVIHDDEGDYLVGPSSFESNISFQLKALQMLKMLPATEFKVHTLVGCRAGP